MILCTDIDTIVLNAIEYSYVAIYIGYILYPIFFENIYI